MTKPSNLDSVEKGTGKPWSEWLAFFERIKAEELDHTHIAAQVYTELDGKVENPGWWAQGVTVAYEQYTDRRAPGQRSDGTFECSVSKTFDESREDLYARIAEKMEGLGEIRGYEVGNTRTSVTPVRSYWKCDLSDGTKLTCAIEPRGDTKSTLVITHSQLANAQQRDEWHEWWKQFLAQWT